MEWENPFDGQEEEFELFVPYVRGTYAYPYASRITGQDYRFGFVRKFLPRVRGELCDYGREYKIMLPQNGIYEIGIKRWSKEDHMLQSREVHWYVLFDSAIYEIERNEVLYYLSHPLNQIAE
ncbi:hypothetical protein JQM68_02180 [Oscillibacter valericigenes]|uniref:hypothetical protein n=1 Tax=Oscillibacter valericigenes TaxID=351091 RepID=UPI001F3D481D|nr:hypothetical protein [Oscillibacter valericigenes]MCF2615999.1 hypothetical protein [Oscillibacter valericigenes]